MPKTEFTLAYDFDEFIDAYVAHQDAQRAGTSPNLIFATVFGLLGAVLLYLTYSRFGTIDLKNAVLPLGLALAVAILAVKLPTSVSRPSFKRCFADQWEQLRLEGKSSTYRIDAETIQVEDSVMGGHTSWNELYAWHENDRFILLYRSKQFFYYITKNKVSEAVLLELKEYLVSSTAKLL